MAPFDMVVRGGTVIDGTGEASREADVAVQGGRIAAVGKAVGGGARRSTPRAWPRTEWRVPGNEL